MSLSSEDLEQVRDVVVDAVTAAIQTLVIPRFDEHDKRLTGLESDVHGIKEDMRVLKEDVRILKTDMGAVKDSLFRLEGRVEALEADVKELYAMVAAQKPAYSDKKFIKLSVEQKVLRMYEDVKLLAQETGVTLPN